ncbi:MAG: hypothetical protein HYT40_00715 [Candidatus Sungbacteria bacterium]|uniref:Uncharacterized protein n=1 Tax=Candidatus Sungiibacteriota bacterium TaxID=2750080 RepID=A0A931WMW1_9BACT|nr:hypothetical protein [Candidatus Sungbacteria bacterium]
MAIDGSSVHCEPDYPGMNEDEEPDGPMGSFEQAILWISGAFVAVALAALMLLVGAGWTIWRFWPAGWRPW